MLKTILIAVVSFLVLGWISEHATGRLLLDGKPIDLKATPHGRVLVRSGLADYKGLSFFTRKGALLRHSGYKLIASSDVPSILNRNLVTLYDGTFMLEPVFKEDKLASHYLKATNLPFYYLASGSPPYVTTEASKIANATIIFDSPLGWYYMLAGRYRALIATLLLLFAFLKALPRTTLLGQRIVWASTIAYVATWATAFHPGLFTADSIHQLTNGATLNFDTMHPPFMAAVGAIFFKLGISIYWLIYLQMIVGLSGLTALYWQLTRSLKYRASATAWLVCLTISPLFPLTPYFISFWKDSWAGIAGLWAAAALLSAPEPPRARIFSTTALVAAALLFSLVRHNSIILSPLWAAIIFFQLRNQLKLNLAKSAAYSAVIGLVLLVSQQAIIKLTGATIIHASNQIYLLELLGTKFQGDEFGPKTPYLMANIVDPDWRVHFDLSRNDQLYGWGAKQVVSGNVAKFTEPVPELIKEYWNGWKTAPLSMILVKLKIFYLLLSDPRSPYSNGIATNSLNIKFSESFAATREVLFWITERVWNSSNRILALPITSFALLTLLFISNLLNWGGGKNRRKILSVYALCLGLYLVFLAACPSSEFRYLFPATILALPIILAKVTAAMSREDATPKQIATALPSGILPCMKGSN